MEQKNIIIEEQGLRDGIQNLSQLIPTEKKLDFVNKLIDAGLKRIQLASFVHPKLVPQMADAEKLIAQLPHSHGVLFSGLVLNLKGVERAVESGIPHISCSISCSNAHSLKNTKMSLTEARSQFIKMVRLAKVHQLKVRAGLQCAFGCRYEGCINEDLVLDMVDAHLQEDIDELALADSTGMANPKSLFNLISKVVEKANGIPVILHLHNTESKGLANLYAAINAGVKIFDTAFGGLGGCPFIKGATGNIATEDTVHMLHQMGYETGIDLQALSKISIEMESILEHKLPGNMYRIINNNEIKIC